MDRYPEREETEIIERRPPPRPGWRERWWIAGIVLLLFVAALIAFFVLRERDEAAPAGEGVPDVVALQEDDAVRRLEARGLRPRLERESREEAKGTVVEQEPEAGSEVEDGETVTLVVSEGPETRTVTRTETVTVTETVAPEPVELPDVVGEDYVTAGATLDELNIAANVFPVPSIEPRGTIVAQNPDPRSEVPEGTAIRINVAIGEGPRRTVTVPDVTGPEAADARELCRRARLTYVVIVRAAPSEDEVGEVLAQQPAPGTDVPELTQVRLFVGVQQD